MSELLLGRDACEIAARWGVSSALIGKLQSAASNFEHETRREVRLISGYRTQEEQDALEESGRPTAPDYLSTHRTCPATGVDVSFGFLPTRHHKATWGHYVTLEGLRWGGGGPLDEDHLPLDWGHVDEGPRA